jgi:hypothetical protein
MDMTVTTLVLVVFVSEEDDEEEEGFDCGIRLVRIFWIFEKLCLDCSRLLSPLAITNLLSIMYFLSSFTNFSTFLSNDCSDIVLSGSSSTYPVMMEAREEGAEDAGL